MKTLQAPLDKLSADARTYPVHLLRKGETGLCLFAAAFLGINDAIHMARMDMEVTCVDIDAQRLGEMSELYEGWTWEPRDAWAFARAARLVGKKWDVVSVDTWTGDATTRSMESLDLWCCLARRVVTATITDRDLPRAIPDGWQIECFWERSRTADWLVLTRETT